MERPISSPLGERETIQSAHWLQFAHLELLDPRLIGAELIIIAGLVGLLAVVGPLGTDHGRGLIQRLAFWGSCAAVCWPPCHAQTTLTLYFARARAPALIVLTTAGGALFVAVPCAAVTYTFHGLFQPNPTAVVALLDVYLVCAAVVVACVALTLYLACQRVRLKAAAGNTHTPRTRPQPAATAGRTEPLARSTPEAGAEAASPVARRPRVGTSVGITSAPGTIPAPPPPPPRQRAARAPKLLLERLPRRLSRDVICLRAVEHYIDVTTVDGSALVLKQFAQAADELRERGMRVHRSYWVAHAHVDRLVRREHRTLLRLSNGEEVPVSRTYRDEARRRYDDRVPRVRPLPGAGRDA